MGIEDLKTKLKEAKGEPKDGATGASASNHPQAEIAKEFRLARERLAKLEGLDKDLRAVFPDYAARVEQERKAVEALAEKVRGCKPVFRRLL